jgi:TP901 family phage tail tape measure protein
MILGGAMTKEIDAATAAQAKMRSAWNPTIAKVKEYEVALTSAAAEQKRLEGIAKNISSPWSPQIGALQQRSYAMRNQEKIEKDAAAAKERVARAAAAASERVARETARIEEKAGLDALAAKTRAERLDEASQQKIERAAREEQARAARRAEAAAAKREEKAAETAIAKANRAIGILSPESAEKRIQTLQAEARRHFFTGQTLMSNFTLPAALVAGGSVYMGAQLDSRMNKIAALTQTPRSAIPGITNQVIGLSREVPQSATELADAMYQVTSAGFKGQSAFEIMETSAKGAAAGMGETKDVADVLTGAMNAYGASADKAGKYTDILTEAVNLGKGEAKEFAPAIGKVVGTASMMGISFAQVAASIATLSRINIKPDIAATSLNQLILKLASPGDKAKSVMKKIGITPQQVREEMGDDSKGGLAGLLGRIAANPKVGIEEFDAITGNIRGLRAALGTAGVQAKEYVSVLKDLEHSQGATKRAMEEMSQSFDFQWNRMLNVGKGAVYELAGHIMPSLIRGMKSVSDAIPSYAAKANVAWNDAGPVGQNVALTAGAGLIAAGPLFHSLALLKDIKAGWLQTAASIKGNPLVLGGTAIAGLVLASHATGSIGEAARGITGSFSNWKGPLDLASIALNGIMVTALAIQAIKMGPGLLNFGSAIKGGFGAAGASIGGYGAEIAASGGLINYLKYGSNANKIAASEAGGIPRAAMGGTAIVGGFKPWQYAGIGVGEGVGAGIAGVGLGAAGLSAGAWLGAAYYQEFQRNQAEAEGRSYEMRTRNIGINRTVGQLFGSVSNNDVATAVVGKVKSEIDAAGDDAEGLQHALLTLSKADYEITKVGLSPTALAAAKVDMAELRRQIVSKKFEVDLKIKTSYDQVKEDLAPIGSWISRALSGAGGVVSRILDPFKIDSMEGVDLSDATLNKLYPPKPVPKAPPSYSPVLMGPWPKPKPKIDYSDYGAVTAALKEMNSQGASSVRTLAQSHEFSKLMTARTDLEKSRKIRNDIIGRGGVGDESEGKGKNKVTDAQRAAVDKQTAALESQQEAARGLAQAYNSYGSVMDGILSKIREFSTRTEEARVANEMQKKALDGVSQSYKTQAIEVAALTDKMGRMVTVKDLFKNFFGGLQQSVMQGGGDINVLNPSIARASKLLDFKGRMGALTQQGLKLGGSLAESAQGQANALEQSIKNLAASIKDLSDSISGRKSSGASPGYLTAMEKDAGKNIGLQCGEAISHYLGGKGTATSLTARGLPIGSVHGPQPPGTIFHFKGGRPGYKHNHYAEVGSSGDKWTESNWGIKNGVTTSRGIDWDRDIAAATWGGRVHISRPDGSAVPVNTPNNIPAIRFRHAAKIAAAKMGTYTQTAAQKKMAADALSDIENQISGSNTNFDAMLGLSVGPHTLDASNQWALRQLLSSVGAQQAIEKFANDYSKTHKGAKLKVQEAVSLMREGAIAADREIKQETGTQQFLADQADRQREAVRISAEGNPLLEMAGERAIPGGQYRNMTKAQYKDMYAGHKTNYLGGIAHDASARARQSEDALRALGAGSSYLDASGVKATEQGYSHIVQLEQKRNELQLQYRSISLTFPDLARQLVESDLAAYQLEQKRTELAQYRINLASQELSAQDRINASRLKTSLIKGGMTPEDAETQSQAQTAYDSAFRAAVAGGSATPHKDAREAKRLFLESADVNKISNNASAVSTSLRALSDSIAALGDQSGIVAKSLELDAQGVSPEDKSLQLNKLSELYRSQHQLSLRQGMAGIGSRNDIEKLQAQAADFEGSDIAKRLKVSNPKAYQADTDYFSDEINAAKVRVPAEYAANFKRQNEEKLDQQKVELAQAFAITDAQRAEVEVLRAQMDAKAQGLVLSKEQEDTTRKTSIEQMKVEDSIDKQRQKMEDFHDLQRNIQGGLEGLMSGKKNALGDMLDSMAGDIRRKAAHALTGLLTGGLRNTMTGGGRMPQGVTLPDGTNIPSAISMGGAHKSGGFAGILGSIFGGAASSENAYSMAVQMVQMQAQNVNLSAVNVNMSQSNSGAGVAMSGGKKGMSASQFALSAASIFISK